MKPIRLTPKFTAKLLTASIIMALPALALQQQAFAAQEQAMPVTDLDSIQFDQNITLAELSAITLNEDKASQNSTFEPTVTSENIFLNDSTTTDTLTVTPKVDDSLKTAQEEFAKYQKKEEEKKAQQAEMKEKEAQVKRLSEETKVKPSETVTASVQKSSKVNGQVVAGKATVDASNDAVIDKIQRKQGKSYQTVKLNDYAKKVNSAVWTPNMRKNTAMTVKLQALLDWNHASPGPVDGGWGMNSKKALKNFQLMNGLPTTGKMNQATWDALTKNIDSKQPVMITYTIRPSDAKYKYAKIPGTYPEKAKLKALNYQSIQEKIAEEYHMNIRYLKKLNRGKKFAVGDTITVYNPGKLLKSTITKVVANKKNETLLAYNGNKLVATYPTTVGSESTPSPHGTFKIANRVKKPHYKATVEKEGEPKKTYMLKPGPNSPVGIVWMGLTKPSYGIHGSPVPEGISRQASHGCIRLTNWDALEVLANIKHGATVVLE